MIFLKLLLSISGLTFFAAATNEHSSLLNYVKPEHYNIKLIPYVVPYQRNIYYGECNVSINILQPTHIINLYSDVKCIMNAELIDNPPRFQKDDDKEKIIYKPIKYLRDNKTHITEFIFMNELSSGRYILNMQFVGIIANNGGFRILSAESENRGWIAATHYQTFARRLFPCWDKPALKTTFNISIIHHRNYSVLSNTPMRKVKVLENDMLWTYFNTIPAISTYLIAAVVVKSNLIITLYDETTIKTTDINIDNSIYLHKVITNITLYLKKEWKRPKMIFTIHVAILHFQHEELAHSGLVLYRVFDIVYANKESGRKIKVLRFVIDKIIQEWFLSEWYNMWLNEAIGIIFGTYIIDKVYPEIRMMDLFVVQIQQECLHLDADPSMWPLTAQVNSSFEIPNYIRASVILRMMQYVVGEKSFWKGIRTYIYNYDYQRTSYDFWTAMQTGCNKTQYEFNITKQMDPWINQRHYPVLTVMRSPDRFSNIILKILNTSKNWSIPLTYTTQAHINFNNTLPEIWLNMSDMERQLRISNILHHIVLKENEWIIFNLKQTGYYRVNYDVQNWRMISNYLNSTNYTNIHVLNRAQLIDDAFHLTIIRQLDSSIFWNLTNYLSLEEDYVAWYPMFKAVEYMSSVFPLQDKKVIDIKVKMLRILKNLYRKTRKDIPKNDLETCLQQEVAKWACFFDDPLCKKDAGKIIDNLFLVDPIKKFRLIPQWDKWTYCKGLANVNRTWWDVYNYYTEVPNNKYLKFIACSENSDNIKLFLNLMENVTSTDYTSKILIIESFLFAVAKHVKNDDVLIHILHNFAKLKIRYVNSIVALTVIINHVYTEHQLNMITWFLHVMLYEATKLDEFKRKNISYVANKGDNILIEIKKHYWLIKHKITKRLPEIQIQIDYLKSFAPKRDELEKSVIEEEEEKEEKKINIITKFVEGIIQYKKETGKEEKVDKIKEIILGILRESGEK